MANINGYEIERKFLIEYPNKKMLEEMQNCTVLTLEQAYIKGGFRVRKVINGQNTFYIKTVKEHISDITRKETESSISSEEYQKALENIADGTSVINKTRYCIEQDGLVFEIDVFPFWNDRAFLEVELTREEEQFNIPTFIKVIKEVTNDRRYRNSALAKEIINEVLI